MMEHTKITAIHLINKNKTKNQEAKGNANIKQLPMAINKQVRLRAPALIFKIMEGISSTPTIPKTVIVKEI